MKKLSGAMLKVPGTLVILVTLWFFGGVLWPLDIPQASARPDRLLLTNVQIVDVEFGLLRSDHSILVEGGEIVAVGRGLAADDARVLDAGGRYAIPGLFDMHTHSVKLSPALLHPLFVAAGVTAVRDLGGCVGIPDTWVACAEDKRVWDQAVRAGSLVGPRYDHIGSLQVDGGTEIPSRLDPGLGAATPAGARARVALDKMRGIDFLKPYTMISRAAYFALAEAARENNMYLAGHQPLAVSALEVIAAGQRSIEHAVLFIMECYTGVDALRGAVDVRAVYTTELRLRMIEQHDPELCAAIHAAMAAAGTAFVPTHTTRKLDAYAIDLEFRSDARLRYVPGPLQFLWRQDADGMAERAGAGGQDSYQAFYEFGIEQTGVAHRAGVMILAGTDAPDSFVFAGTSLHDELDHFIRAGLSPLEALRTATIAPAAFLGLEHKAGVIKVGARADIVLLDDNPLVDIRAVRNIEAVVLAGSVYERADLDAMLQRVEDTAGSWSMWPKFVWQALRSPIMRRQFAD